MMFMMQGRVKQTLLKLGFAIIECPCDSPDDNSILAGSVELVGHSLLSFRNAVMKRATAFWCRYYARSMPMMCTAKCMTKTSSAEKHALTKNGIAVKHFPNRFTYYMGQSLSLCAGFILSVFCGELAI
eukprot:6212951-Pleurochrysis_carterae.AAC.3